MKSELQKNNSLDTIFIEGLMVETVIGICDWEQQVPQALYFDVTMQIDTRPVAQQNDLSLGIDYADVANFVKTFVVANEAKLLEVLLDRLAKALLERFPAQHLSLTVKKPAAIETPGVAGITIERGRESD